MNRKIKDSLPLFCVVIILIASFFASISFVHAGASFKKNSDMWVHLSDNIDANYQTYPYDSDTATVTYVSMDIVYGIRKQLITYHGELPYEQTHNNSGDAIDGWAGYPYGDPAINQTDYWGNIPKMDEVITDFATNSDNDYTGNFKSKSTAEKINDDKVVSLRLYAISHTRKGWFNVGNGCYFVMQGLAWLVSMIVSLVVTAKNLDMNFILHAIHLDKINDLLTKNFIYDSDKKTISVFTGFCLIMLVFAFVSYTIRYVKGAEKTRGIWDIILTMIIGLMVMGMCLSGKTTQLGTTLANGVSKLIYTVSDAMNDGNGNAFKVKIEDKENDNKIVQLSELSMIYKTYIDIQLCTQFNVDSVDYLDFAEIGSDTSKLEGFTNQDDFSSNLGYYYWFANSSAKEKIIGNRTLPEIRSGEAEDKLASMITYLQVSYDNATTEETKSRIVDIIGGFSKPDGLRGALLMLAFTIVMVLLGLVLLKYALNVIIAKIELFIALIGLAIAGPLILTNKKKLVETGKFIVGMLFVSIIEITIWSIFFDLIIYTVATMLSAELGRIIVTIAFLLLFLKFNPAIAQKIKQIMDNSTRAISPTFQQGRNAIKQKLRQYGREGLNKFDNSQKVVGYDKDGKAITVSRKGSLASRMAHMAVNGLEDANQRKTWSKLRADAKDAKAENKKKAAEAIQRDAENKVKQVEQDIAADAERTKNQINADTERDVNDAIETDVSGNFVTFNMDKLTEDETKNVFDLKNLENDEKDLINDKEYKELLKEQKDIEEQNKYRTPEEQEEMDPEKLEKLKLMQAQIANKQKQIYNKKQKIISTIRDRAKLENAAKRGVNVNVRDGESIDEAVARCVNVQAQQDMSEEYAAALQDAINANASMVDNPEYDDTSKISKHKKMSVNKKAVKSQAIAAMKLAELKSGEAVSSDTELQSRADGIVDIIEKKNETLLQRTGNSLKHEKEEIPLAEVQRAKAKYKNATKFSKARRDAKKEYKEAVAVAEATKDSYNERVNDAAAMVRADTGTGRIINKATISDQINSLAKLDRSGDVDVRTSRKAQEDAVAAYKENKAQIKNEAQTYIKETTDRVNNPESARKATINAAENRAAANAKNVSVDKSPVKQSNAEPTVTRQPEVINKPATQTQTYVQPEVNKQPVKQSAPIESGSTVKSKQTSQPDIVSNPDTNKTNKFANQPVEKPVEVAPVQNNSTKSVNDVINKYSAEKPVVDTSSTTKFANTGTAQPIKQTTQESTKYTTPQPEAKPTPQKQTNTIPNKTVVTPTTNTTPLPAKTVEKPVAQSNTTPVNNNNVQPTRKVENVIERHSASNTTEAKPVKATENVTPKQVNRQEISQPTTTAKPVSSPTPAPAPVNNGTQNAERASRVINNNTKSEPQKPVNKTPIKQESAPTPKSTATNPTPKPETVVKPTPMPAPATTAKPASSTSNSIPKPTPVVKSEPTPKPVSMPTPTPVSKPTSTTTTSTSVPKQEVTPKAAPQPTVEKEKPVIKLATPKTEKAIQKAATAQATSTVANRKKEQANENLKSARDTTAEAKAKKAEAQNKAEKEQAARELRMAKEKEKLAERQQKEAEKQAKLAEAAAKKAEKKQNKKVEKETKKVINKQTDAVQKEIDKAYTQRTQAKTRQDEIDAANAAQEAIMKKEALKSAEKSHGLGKTRDAVSVEDLEKNFDKDLESITSTFKHED